MSENLTLSIILPNEENLPASLVHLDQILDRLRYSSFEIIVLENEPDKKNIKTAEVFNKFLPHLSYRRPSDFHKHTKGSHVLFIRSSDGINFDHIDKLLSERKEKTHMAFIVPEPKNAFYRFLDGVTHILLRVFDMHDLHVPPSPHLVYVEKRVLGYVPIFSTARSAVYANEKGLKIKSINSGKLSSSWKDFVYPWKDIFYIGLNKWKQKAVSRLRSDEE